MHQRTRPVRLVFLAFGLAVALVGVAPASTSITQAQEPRSYLYEYRGPLPATSLQSLASEKLDVESGAITPVSGTIEILVEEIEQDLEETEPVETVLYRFEARVEIFGESREWWDPPTADFPGIFQPCTWDHWRWVSESILDSRLTDGGIGMRLGVHGPTINSYIRPACSHEEPLESGDTVTFKLFRGDGEDSWLACAYATDQQLLDDGTFGWRDDWTPEECLASAVELPVQS